MAKQSVTICHLHAFNMGGLFFPVLFLRAWTDAALDCARLNNRINSFAVTNGVKAGGGFTMSAPKISLTAITTANPSTATTKAAESF